jgi:hypothetical protein
MPYPKVNQDWVKVLYMLKANQPGLGAGSAHTQLERAREAGGVTEPVPGERTIGRYLREWKNLKPEEQAAYRYVSWPETFEQGGLPWEAQAATLELLRLWARRLATPPAYGGTLVWAPPRPTVEVATWHWHLALAAPDAPADQRCQVAEFLAVVDLMPSEPVYRQVEAWLQYAPWQSEAARAAYQEALGSKALFS